MSKQITVRLPDELVDFMDELVASDRATSRASVVARAMERERRRELAARDVAILAERGGYPDLEGLAPAAAVTVLSDLD
ncbi:YlcI/YnfO family protein [Kribbella sp. NPDC026611]|uniref:ribbon-helix-helix domain-containing protein n=1 Tax=Kribbella sp. NPDC026611 TaxID=3154911 RepID=UPI0033E65A2B